MHIIERYLSERRIPQSEMARRIGCDRGNFSRIVSGKSVPSPKIALALEAETDGDLDAALLNPMIAEARGIPPSEDFERPLSSATSITPSSSADGQSSLMATESCRTNSKVNKEKKQSVCALQWGVRNCRAIPNETLDRSERALSPDELAAGRREPQLTQNHQTEGDHDARQ